MYLVDSDLVHIIQLRPPGLQSIQVYVKYDTLQTKFHRDFPGEGLWHGQISRNLELIPETISDKNKESTFWCSVCDKGLFFPKNCKLHPNPRYLLPTILRNFTHSYISY